MVSLRTINVVNVIVALFQQVIIWSLLFGRSQPTETGPLSFANIYLFAIANIVLFMYNYKEKASLRTLGALFINAFLVLVGGFSFLYWSYGSQINFTVTATLSRLDAVYFTLGTLTTAGTGSISATSEASRYIQSLQMVLDLVLMVFAVGLLIAQFTSSDKSRSSDSGDPTG